MKRFFSILLVAMLVMTSLATVAFAEGTATVSINHVEAKAGEEVTLTVTVSGEFANYELYVQPESGLTITNISGIIANVETGKVAYATDANISSHSFKVTVKVADDAVPGTYYVGADVLFIANSDLEKQTYSVSSGSVTVVCDHAWNSGEKTKDPTCDTAGEILYTCTKCNETKVEYIAALGHDYETVWSWDEQTHWHECTRCGHKADHEDHLLGWHVIKKPTTTETGLRQQICETCGYVAAEEVLEKVPLDDVPHTGDITDQVVLGSFVTMMTLAAAAWFVFRRKAAN